MNPAAASTGFSSNRELYKISHISFHHQLVATATTSSSLKKPAQTHFQNHIFLLPLRFSRRKSTPIVTVKAASSSIDGNDYQTRESPSKILRKLLESPGVHQGPACFDALSAKLVQKAGFQFCFTTGFGISAASLGLPDTGYISYGEMVDQGRKITQAVSIPVIGDADNGYGNAMNVKRTVKGFVNAGFAGIRKVVSREEAVMMIKAAVDARKEIGFDIVIVARTDSRQAVSFDEALWRMRAFADAGADVLFIDALASKEEMKTFCEVYPLVPKMGNMLEGGGKTPILTPIELEEVGFKVVAYPLSLLGVSMQAMQDALMAIKGGRMPSPGSMPSFEEMKEILGFKVYYEEEKKYAISASQNNRGSVSPSSDAYKTLPRVQEDPQVNYQSPQDPVVEVITPDVYTGSRDPFSRIWSRTLRIRIIGRDGVDKLDVRLPAGFLDGITNIVPALGSVNLKELLENAAEDARGKALLDFNDTMGDRILVFLE